MKKFLTCLLCGASFFAAPLFADAVQKEEVIEVGNRAIPIEERLSERMAIAQQEKEASEKESPFKNAKMAAAAYPLLHPGTYHNMMFLSIMGDRIELEDGSAWFVRPDDSYKIMSWLASDLLVISPNHAWFSSYEYVVTNQQTGDAIAVNLLYTPICRGPYCHWIVAVDYYSNYVYLEDGTIWVMRSFNSDIVYRWMVGDYVIIGVNDGYFSASYPNILININTLDYASGSFR